MAGFAIQNAGTITATLVSTSSGGTVSATYGYFRYVSGTNITGTFSGDGSGLTGVTAASSDRIVSGTTQMVAVSTTGYISVTQAGTNTAWFDPTRGLVTLGVSATGPISGSNGYFSGKVGSLSRYQRYGNVVRRDCGRADPFASHLIPAVARPRGAATRTS